MDSPIRTSKRLPLTASVVAFVSAESVVLAGLIGPIVAVPVALIPFWAGIGILRNRVWSAYGYATLLFAQLLLVPLMLARPGLSAGRATQIVGTMVGSVGLGVLFCLRAARWRHRALAGAECGRGSLL